MQSDCFEIFQSQFGNPPILPFDSDNVTWFGTNKSCSNRSHLSGCFKCSSGLACKTPRAQLSICVPVSLSRIHLAASLHLCPADCFQEMIEQAQPLTGTSWHCSDISSDISARWAHESNSIDVNIIRPMECRLATLNSSSPTLSHALEKTKAARIGVTAFNLCSS